jgi:hypothetical protein
MPAAPAAPHPHPPAHRPWAVAAISWLLLIETAALLLLAFVNLGRPIAVAFLALAILAVVAAVGFVWVRRGGWVNAVLVQGGGLLLALWLYFGPRPMYCYLMMLAGILMVLYLHQADVQAAFRQAPGPEPGPP